MNIGKVKSFLFHLTTHYGKYTDSQNAALYERIAQETDSEPQHVYELAHGKERRGAQDAEIWYELKEAGVIHFHHR